MLTGLPGDDRTLVPGAEDQGGVVLDVLAKVEVVDVSESLANVTETTWTTMLNHL